MSSLNGSVVVVTGASGGIGRCASRLFARAGATLILAARRDRAVEDAARECRDAGGEALAVPTDVSKEAEVAALAERALDAYGRIDVWVNNAAITGFGRIEEMPADVYDQIIQTNLFGYIYGARAVIPIFREQGHGVIINNASMVSYVGQPYTSAYVTSKHGIRGLSECLRMELIDAPDIRVSTVLPASIDTPLFQQGANYTGRTAKPMDPVYPAEKVAETILALAIKPRREAAVGNAARVLWAQHTAAPGLTERMMAATVESNHFGDATAPASKGNVYEPMQDWAEVSGGWLPDRPDGWSNRFLIGAAALAVAVPCALLTLANRRRHVARTRGWS